MTERYEWAVRLSLPGGGDQVDVRDDEQDAREWADWMRRQYATDPAWRALPVTVVSRRVHVGEWVDS